MAKVNIEGIIRELGSEMRRALRDTVEEVIPEAEFSDYRLFQEFREEVDVQCRSWERVSDHLVKKES